LPRLARFDQKRFTQYYLTETLAFLTKLDNATSFLPSAQQQQINLTSGQVGTSNLNTSGLSASSRSSRTATQTVTSSATNISANSNNTNLISGAQNGVLFGAGTLKSEVLKRIHKNQHNFILILNSFLISRFLLIINKSNH